MEVILNEDDISTEKKAKSQGSWLSEKNEYKRWKKGTGSQKIKGKKRVISIGHSFCGLSS